MLQILALIVLACVAADISRRIYLNQAFFEELKEPISVAWLVWLYPLPFFLPLFAKSFFAFFLYRIPLGMLFFIPALISARASRKCFELSCDSRAKPALAAVEMTTTAGVMGIMGIVILSFMCWVFGWPKAYVQ